MKRKIILIIAIQFLILSNSFVYADNSSAKSSIIMDVNTGRILHKYNEDLKLPMASTTKIMTTLIAIENADLNEIVTISEKASLQEGSSVYLKIGEKVRLEDLLYAIMLKSGNDAAYAVAEHISRNIENFSQLMNEKAKFIGAKNTNFKNPHGLPDDKHYTTAYDLALITCYALKNEKFSEIVQTQNKIIPGPPDANWDRKLVNKNKMLFQYKGGDGVKTGFTKKAGRCLVTSATRDDWRIVAVVLNCGDWWNHSANLLDNAFDNYTNVKVIDRNTFKIDVTVLKGKSKTVKLIPRNDFYAPLLNNQDYQDQLFYIPHLNSNIIAPIKKHEKSGVIKLFINETYLGEVDLYYTKEILKEIFK